MRQDLLQPARVHRLSLHLGPQGQGLQQRQVGGQAHDAAVGQRAPGAAQHIFEMRRVAVHDELGQQGVVVRRRTAPLLRMTVQAYARTLRPVQFGNAAAAGAGVALGIQGFGIDAPLHGIAARPGRGIHIQAQVGEMLARRNADLGLHQIDAKDLFGNRMLHLQTRVGLDEHIGQRLGLQIDQKLERAQAFVAQPGCHAQRIFGDALAQRLRQAGTGCNLHQLLKAPLQRAFALAQRHRPFAAVAQQLDLDVARAAHQPLDIDAVHAKGRLRLAAAALVGGRHLASLGDRTHAATAAAANRLDHDAAGTVGLLARKELLGLLQRHGLGAAGHQGHAALLRQRTGSGLVAKQRQLLGRRSDKAQPRCRTGARKVRVLAEKTIARVQRVATVLLRDTQQMRAIEIGSRAAGSQCLRLVCGLYMRGLCIIGGVHRQAGNAQLLQRSDDAQGDFTAVGDQDFLEHRTLV